MTLMASRRALSIAVLAWWFIGYAGYKDGVATHGPFKDKEQCEVTRSWFAERFRSGGKDPDRYTSWCWWDGKP